MENLLNQEKEIENKILEKPFYLACKRGHVRNANLSFNDCPACNIFKNANRPKKHFKARGKYFCGNKETKVYDTGAIICCKNCKLKFSN